MTEKTRFRGGTISFRKCDLWSGEEINDSTEILFFFLGDVFCGSKP